jgi:hypothetical protein
VILKLKNLVIEKNNNNKRKETHKISEFSKKQLKND